MKRWLLFFSSLGLLLACENSVDETGGSGGASSSTTSTSTSTSSGSGGAAGGSSGTAGAGACPAQEPADGSDCDEEGL